MIDVFISYAAEDADWARSLAEGLAGHGLHPFFDEWHVLPGDILVHRLDEAVLASANGIAVVSPASARSAPAQEEYAALARASAERDLRFIPVLLGNAAPPPFAANRTWRDFTALRGQAYRDGVAELAAVIADRSGERAGPERPARPLARENVRASLPSPPRPVTEPQQHHFVVCYAAADADYGHRLAGLLGAEGLPVWSIGDLRPGDAHFWSIRQQLRYAIAVVVVMTPHSQDSDDVTRMILEGLLHGRPFVPVLLEGERNYHLAHTWYVDARDGGLLGDGELALLRRLHRADAAGRPPDPADVLPPPLLDPPVPAVRVPAAASLDRLNRLLTEGEYEHADLATTALLLEAAQRLDEGWMRAPHATDVPLDLLAGIDAVWSRHTGQRQGFAAQLALAEVRDRRPAAFLPLSVALGWRASAQDTMPRLYREFSRRAAAGRRTGFFPTLRNPQNEHFPDWYDQWTATVLAVHLRLRQWRASPCSSSS